MLRKRFIKPLVKLFNRKKYPAALVLKRSEHAVSRSKISQNALKVMYRLKKAGYSAYIVGGGVRDLLLEKKPKDFDVVTDALPQQVRKLFRNSRIIGRRFLLVHVFYHGENVEVSTFRANSEQFTQEEAQTTKASQANNVYGTIEEDAWRRDFTVNALYYSIDDFSIIDYTGGLNDLRHRQIRMIGDPTQRYHEDPVRLLRAIRLAAKLNFKIETGTQEPIKELMHLLQHVPMARLYDEVIKLFFDGFALVTYRKLKQLGFFKYLFPHDIFSQSSPHYKTDLKFIRLCMKSMDERFYRSQTINPGFLFAALLWPGFQQSLKNKKTKTRLYQSLFSAMDEVMERQKLLLAIPKRLTSMIRAIWILQFHLLRRRKNRVVRLFQHRYFRAAIDFLELRMSAGESYQFEVTWWRNYQQSSPAEREKMLLEME